MRAWLPINLAGRPLRWSREPCGWGVRVRCFATLEADVSSGVRDPGVFLDETRGASPSWRTDRVDVARAQTLGRLGLSGSERVCRDFSRWVFSGQLDGLDAGHEVVQHWQVNVPRPAPLWARQWSRPTNLVAIVVWP